MKVLVTGAAGFIGMHLAKAFLDKGDQVLGIDNINDYYDPKLKNSRLKNLLNYDKFNFELIDIQNNFLLKSRIKNFKPDYICHLAAQAGVRHSIDNPKQYLESNILGFFNILELARELKNCPLLFASSSSVYGSVENASFSETSNTDSPVSFYAATKKSNELMASSYCKIYDLDIIGIRYFTVYGPWGRPDMAPWIFTSKIINEDVINVFNNGNMERDFTYIDDAVEGTMALIDSNIKGYEVFNIGSNRKVKIIKFIQLLEKKIGKEAKINYLPMQLGDVLSTSANIKKIIKFTKYNPKVLIENGLENWVSWYKKYNTL